MEICKAPTLRLKALNTHNVHQDGKCYKKIYIKISTRVFKHYATHTHTHKHAPAGTAGEFSSPVSTFCSDSYFGIRSTPVLPQ